LVSKCFKHLKFFLHPVFGLIPIFFLQGVGSATNGSGDSPRPISGEATEVDLSLPRAFQAAVEEGLLPKMPPEVLKHREAADRSDFQLWIFFC
jgi:hypothetical protein